MGPSEDCGRRDAGRQGGKEESLTLSSESQRDVRQHSIDNDNSNDITCESTEPTIIVTVIFEYGFARNRNTIRTGCEHAVTLPGAVVVSIVEFVPHHRLERPSLVIDLGDPTPPENVQDGERDHEPIDAHPKTVGERDKCE